MGLFDRFKKNRKPAGDSPAITERPVGDENLHNIRGCARDCAAELGLDMDALSPEQLVSAVNDHIRDWQKQSLTPPESPFKHEPLILGSLWGEQLVATLNWEWVMAVCGNAETMHEHAHNASAR